MEVQHSFAVLSEIVAAYESGPGSIRQVETATDGAGGPLRARLELTIDRCGGGTVAPTTATLTEEGGLQVAYDPADLPPIEPPAVDGLTVIDREARVDGRTPVVSIQFRIDPRPEVEEDASETPETGGADARSEPSGRASRDADSTEAPESGAVAAVADPGTRGPDGRDGTQRPEGLARVRDTDVPPFEDTPYLRELYETCETFTEMSRRIEMDVSGETVRRYMIEAGVHDPESYDARTDAGPTTANPEAGDATATGAGQVRQGPEGTDEGGPDEQLVADGLGLPSDVELEELVDAVVDARCIYDVTRKLDLDQQRTRDLLAKLDLMDLVSHRLTKLPERDTSYEEVAARIRQYSPETA